jgi:hypothetical protein
MEPNLTVVLDILAIAASIGRVTVNIQQVSAPRSCGSCTDFRKLTHEFEKAVIGAATIGDPNIVRVLLVKYNADVRALDFTS